MGELFNPYPRLPKNIRQIGERDDVVKLYVEDYVNTYLKRLYPAGGQELRVGLLLGTAETYDGVPYLFIDGALEMEDVAGAGEKVVFTEAAWKKAYKSIEETFPKRTVQGWFICGAPGCILSPLNYWRQHSQYFGGKNQLMYLNSGIDGEEALYVASEDGFYRLKGYSIYYERNQMMQDYMILRKDARRVESGTGDRVIRDFRTRMEGRKQEAVSRHSTIRTLGTLCSVLSVAVLAGGVVMFNNYQKMKEMESVLVSVLPENIRSVEEYAGAVPEEGLTAWENLWKDELSVSGGMQGVERDVEEPGDGELIVEEIRGSVTPETMGTDLYASSGMEEGAEVPGQPESAQAQPESGQVQPESGQMQPAAGQLQEPSAQGDGEDEPFILPEPEAQNDPEVMRSQNGQPAGTGGYTGGGNATAGKDYPVTNLSPGETYIIGEGETLYGICFKLYDSLKYLDDIRALNRLDDADRIMAGQALVLPKLEETE